MLEGWELTPRSPCNFTDHDFLRKEHKEIRHRCWAQNLYEFEEAVLSLAAPIRDAAGNVVAAMSVAGPGARLDPVMGQTIQAVVEAAATASRRMGYRGGIA